MTEQEKKNNLAKDARNYVKKNWKKIVNQFANTNTIKPSNNPISIFMAGSPGAGKTEISKGFIDNFPASIVHIDTDKTRDEIPQYTGSNSAIVHGAASLAVEKIFDHCLKKKQSFIFDAMFSDFNKAKDNVERCLKKDRMVMIFYIYQEPKLAWEFTIAREKKEGRNIPKEAFIKGFCNSREVSQRIKDEFGDKVMLNIVKKNFDNENQNIYLDVDVIDNYVENMYSFEDLESMI